MVNITKCSESINVYPLQTRVYPLTVTTTDTDEQVTATVWREGLEILDETQTTSVYKYTDYFFGSLDYSAVTQSTDSKLVYV